MRILFSVNLMDLMEVESKMSLESRLPEFVANTLEVSMRDKAEGNARSKIGNGGFGQELAEGIRTQSEGTTVTIDHESNDTNGLAQHVHEGGPISTGTFANNTKNPRITIQNIYRFRSMRTAIRLSMKRQWIRMCITMMWKSRLRLKHSHTRTSSGLRASLWIYLRWSFSSAA